MSFSELRFRVGYRGKVWGERLRSASGKDILPMERFLKKISCPEKGMKVKDDWLGYYRDRRHPVFFIHSSKRGDLLKTLEALDSSAREKTIFAADQILKNKFSFLGIDVDLSPQPQWTTDPLTKKPYPMSFYAEMPIFAGNIGHGDVKHIWELNRHQFLVDLGQAYWLTGDETYVDKIIALVSDWIETNPYMLGINWASSLELAVRGIAWIWTFYFILKSPYMTEDFLRKWLRNLYLHGEYLSHHLSFYFSPYNHLIGEATGLLTIALMFPEFDAAQTWKQRALSVLIDEVEKQFHPDGGTVEQATFYHHFTLGCYLSLLRLTSLNDIPIPDKVGQRIEKALEFSMYMARPDGTLPKIGDIDDAKAIRVAQEPLWEFRDLLAIGSVIFQREDMKYAARRFWPNSLWILGEEGFRSFQKIRRCEPHQKSIALCSSGYFVMRTDWSASSHYLCIDCGPQAAGLHDNHLPSVAHGHADCLSFELAVQGKSLIVDSGFYTYNGPIEWHRYFRETLGHNTVVVDGESQAVHAGRLGWSHAVSGELGNWINLKGFDYVRGKHNGYQRLSSPVVHERRIFFIKPDYWIIFDTLTGRGNHKIDFYFHLAPLKQIPSLKEGIFRTQEEEGRNLRVIPFKRDAIKAELLYDDAFPEGGWIAPSYGERLCAPILRYRWQGELPVCFPFLIYPINGIGKDFIQPEVVYIQDSSSVQLHPLALQVNSGLHTDTVLLNGTDGRSAQAVKLESDGELAFLRQDRSGGLLRGCLVGGSYLHHDGKKVVEVRSGVKGVYVDLSSVPNDISVYTKDDTKSAENKSDQS